MFGRGSVADWATRRVPLRRTWGLREPGPATPARAVAVAALAGRRRHSRRPAASAAPRRRRRDRRALEHVAQLAHVARPVVARSSRDCASRQRRRPRADAAARSRSRKLRGQRRDVLAPLAQRRHGDRIDVPGGSRGPRGSVPRVDLALEVAVGRGDDAHVDVARCVPRRRARTSPSCSTRSSLACSVERQLADLVEEQRAAVGAPRSGPARSRGRAGERAALVAEQLALEQLARDGARS